MDHLAIMKKSLKLLPKILSGGKKIESRWYKSRYPPWDRIKENEVVYFKNSGEPVTMKAEVDKVLQFNLNPDKVRAIVREYGKQIGIDEKSIELFKDKKYCILIFLKHAQEIKPFEIDKTGYGLMSAWICVDDIDEIRR